MSVAKKIKAVLADGKPRTPDELHAAIPGSNRGTILDRCGKLKRAGEIVPLAGHAAHKGDGYVHYRYVLGGKA